MDKIVEDTEGVTLRFSEDEFVIVNNSLNEVSNLLRIPESAFEDRLGGPREETSRLLDGINGRQAIGADGLTIRLSASDLLLLRNAMIETTKGVEIEEWEFQTRLGRSLPEAKLLLREVEDLIEDAEA